MFANWLKRRIQLVQIRNGTQDLERFLLSLEGMSDEELGYLVGLASVLRCNFRRLGFLPDAAIGVGLPLPREEQANALWELSKLVRALQSENQLTDAGGAMVWLHTLRALKFPELRSLGRKMWRELARGFPHVEEAFEQMQMLTGKPVPEEARASCEFVPPELVPRR